MNRTEINDVISVLSEQGFDEAKKQLTDVFERERETLRFRLASLDRVIGALNGNGDIPLPISLQPNALEALERVEARLRKPDLMKVCQEPGCPRKGEPFEAMRKNARFCPECRLTRQSGWAARQKDGKKKRGRPRQVRA